MPAPSASPGTTESWALTASAAAVRSHVFATDIPSGHFENVRQKYTEDQLAQMSGDWIKEMACSEQPVITVPARSDVELAELNSEQKYVCCKLIRHYKATQTAKSSDTPHPAPLRAIVYGLGGTGKSFVLRAFVSWIDRFARAQNTIADSDYIAALALDPEAKKNPAYLISSDIMVVAAPSGVAASAIGGTTLHAAFKFTRM